MALLYHQIGISIHAPRAGSDSASFFKCDANSYFNPRSPCGERPALAVRLPVPEISIHAPRAGSDPLTWNGRTGYTISIHAPRAGSDSRGICRTTALYHFNPRSPCGERLSYGLIVSLNRYFNPRSPCGERLFAAQTVDICDDISIHAPRAGSDVEASHTSILVGISIHAPRAGSDRSLCAYANSFPISIHAPRAGSDPRFSLRIASAQDFNPRSPCGERHDSIALPSATGTFQSTLPVRGATRGRVCGQWMKSISIHAPRAGSDPMRTP